jgi:FeS assembly SUF system regulator
MLRITRLTDYGILLLGRLADNPPGRVLSAREAAGRSGLSLPMVSKILKQLARSEIVSSHRGVGGGYHLARALERISVADVIRALEGPIAMVECAAQPGLCGHEPVCPARVNWNRVNREVERALDRVMLSEMFGGPAPRPVALSTVPAAPETECWPRETVER